MFFDGVFDNLEGMKFMKTGASALISAAVPSLMQLCSTA